eukprot:scaffold27748_cov112-Isochrysis_galbana.AAC.2
MRPAQPRPSSPWRPWWAFSWPSPRPARRRTPNPGRCPSRPPTPTLPHQGCRTSRGKTEGMSSYSHPLAEQTARWREPAPVARPQRPGRGERRARARGPALHGRRCGRGTRSHREGDRADAEAAPGI